MPNENRAGWAIFKIVLVALGVLLAGLVPYPRAYTETMRRAEAHRIAGEYGAALDAYSDASQLDTLSPQPALCRGQVLLHQRRFGQAAQAFVQAQQRGGGLAAWLGLGEARAGEGDWAAALAAWYRAQALAPAEPRVLVALARGNLAQGRFDQAEHHAQRALAAAPPSPVATEAHALLGRLSLVDDLAAAAHNLQAAGDADLVATLDAAAQADAQGLPARREMLLGTAFLRRGELPLARRHLARAAALAPGDAQPLAYLAHTLDLMGATGEARPLLEQALRLDPHSVLAYYFLGLHNKQVGNLPAAQAALWEAAQRDPQNAAVRVEMAEAFVALGEYDQAEEWYVGAVETAPGDIEFQLLLTHFYLDHLYRVEQGGLPAAQAAVALAPHDPRTHDLLGWALFLAGRATESTRALEQALELDPHLTTAHYHIGMVYARTGQVEAARRHLQRAVDLDTLGAYRERAMQLLADL
ncbi:MAG: tetratricopeptide repeat protein [Anaerolineae bacterium]|nr:tetratricopeptide repeat protein [Anaerolineae bacterium]